MRKSIVVLIVAVLAVAAGAVVLSLSAPVLDEEVEYRLTSLYYRGQEISSQVDGDEVLDLLEGRCTSGEEIRERRSCFLAHHDGKFNAVVIRLEHNTEMFRRFAYSTLQDLFPESLFILYRDSILFFANLGNIEQHLEDQASSILTRLSDYLEHANAYAGISIQFERLEQLRLAYVQAEHALETGRKLGG